MDGTLSPQTRLTVRRDIYFDDIRNDQSWQAFHRMRNRVLEVCSVFGTIGPMGLLPFTDDMDEAPDEAWEVGACDPDFFVVDDDYGTQAIRVETDPPRLSLELLGRLQRVLDEEWVVVIAFGEGLFVVSRRGVAAHGPFFREGELLGSALTRLRGAATER